MVCVALLASAGCFEASPPPARSILFVIPTPRSPDKPHPVAIGDANGDGTPDLAVADGVESRGGGLLVARVHSGRDGGALSELVVPVAQAQQWSVDLFALGDVDADGRMDVGVVLPGRNGRPSGSPAYVFSANDGRLVLELANALGEERFGCALTGGGDLDADGRGDVLIGVGGSTGAQEWDPDPGDSPGTLRAISSRTGAVLWEVVGRYPGEEFGATAASTPDLSGDGVGDVLVGAGGWDGSGRAVLLSGRDGRELQEIPGKPGERCFGRRVGVLGDLDRDGAPEFLLQSIGRARIHSGANGSTLAVLAQLESGWALDSTSIGDVDGDGWPEFVASDLRWRYEVDPFEYGAIVACLVSGADGRELAVTEFDQPGFGPDPVVVGDLDADGVRDIALATGDRVYVVSSRRFFFK